MTNIELFQANKYPLSNGMRLIEASAGTGKTFSLSHHVLRLLTEKEYSINDLTSLFDNSMSEPIFFILREMCFGNDNYLVKGDWSNPNSLVIQKINS